MAPILYISYDGLTDPLGRSQILPYLIGLAGRGHRIHILSCEKPGKFERDRATVEALCSGAGIKWHPRSYHKRPPVLSSVYDLAMLKRAAVQLHRAHGFGLTHCRSYIPAAVGLHLKTRFGVPLLFDMRGFWPEEKTEGKSWNLANPLFRMVYRYFKRLESQLLEQSDAIVSLTEAGQRELLRRPELRGEAERITTIPCCVDFDHFPLADWQARAAARQDLGIPPEAATLLYLGSLGTWYMLEEMLDFFRTYSGRNPEAYFLLITPDSAEPIRARAAARGIDTRALVILSASREEVPRLMAAGDLGIFFIAPVFSKIGSSPTKMGEMLAIGMPIVANAGVGDVADILERTRGGAAITDFDEQSYVRALRQVESSSVTADQRRQSALKCFDIKSGIERYEQLYCDVLIVKPALVKAASKRERNSSFE